MRGMRGRIFTGVLTLALVCALAFAPAAGAVTEGEIAEILDREKEPGAAVRALLNAALTAGGVDNITVILCDYV